MVPNEGLFMFVLIPPQFSIWHVGNFFPSNLSSTIRELLGGTYHLFQLPTFSNYMTVNFDFCWIFQFRFSVQVFSLIPYLPPIFPSSWIELIPTYHLSSRTWIFLDSMCDHDSVKLWRCIEFLMFYLSSRYSVVNWKIAIDRATKRCRKW